MRLYRVIKPGASTQLAGEFCRTASANILKAVTSSFTSLSKSMNAQDPKNKSILVGRSKH